MKINIAKDYTETTGGRYIKDGEYSGEDFRDNVLKHKYEIAAKKKEKLIINFDGGYGYSSSFLEEAFGGLKRILRDEGKKIDINIFEFISDDQQGLIKIIKDYIKNAWWGR